MNNEKVKENVRKAVNELLATKGYVAPVDMLVKAELISQRDYSEWHRGKVAFLEKVAAVDLSKLSLAMRELKTIARNKNLKPSKTVYKQWGKNSKEDLRFSKTGAKHIEEAYSTHYVLRKSGKKSPKQADNTPQRPLNKFELRKLNKEKAENKK